MAIKISTNNSYSLYTGITSVKVLALNPTTEEFAKITGRELPFPLSYDKNEKGSVKFNILIQEPTSESFHLVPMYVGGEQKINEGKKGIWIDSNLKNGWMYLDKTGLSEKVSLNVSSARLAVSGELSLIGFLKALFMTDSKESLLDDLKIYNLSYDDILKGKVKAFNTILQQSSAIGLPISDSGVSLMFTVKINDEGKPKQTFLVDDYIRENAFVANRVTKDKQTGETVVSKGWIKPITKYLDDKLTGGYPVNFEYTYEFQEFKQDALKPTPLAPVEEESTVMDASELPF